MVYCMLGGRFVHLAGLAPVPKAGRTRPARLALRLPLAAEVPRQRSFAPRTAGWGARWKGRRRRGWAGAAGGVGRACRSCADPTRTSGPSRLPYQPGRANLNLYIMYDATTEKGT